MNFLKLSIIFLPYLIALTIEEKVPHSTKQILRHEVSDEMRNALFNVVNVNNQYKNARVE